MARARYIMIGGFLGAGKTTAILKLAQHLSARGQRVGLITNDQSVGLVDTAMLGAAGFPVQEITGGCFCCRFNSLVDAADTLTREARPEVFIAEPVGSCTDLKASVSYPLRRMYGEQFSIAPLSVLVDPIRAMRVLNIEPGKAFSQKVIYVYGKQLEEAEIIAVNKVDLLSADQRMKLRAGLEKAFPKAKVVEISARVGTGMNEWFELMAGSDLGSADSMDVDYEVYAEGEALLGWMNCTVDVTAAGPVDGNALVRKLAGELHGRLKGDGVEVAHLKMTLTPESGNDIAVLNLVRTDGAPEMSHTLQGDIRTGQLIVNLRAEADPESLKTATVESLAACESADKGSELELKVEHLEHFRPGKPEPTYRYANA